MKIIYLIFLLQVANGQETMTELMEQIRRDEIEQVAMWQKNLADSEGLEPDKRISSLWLGLRNIGYRKSVEGHSKDVESLYWKIQKEILDIPGHAQYFVDELEKERAAIKPGSYRSDYDALRRTYIAEVLRHLPSPETINVLGKYLRDHRDDPPPINPNRPFDASAVPSSARLASEAIMYIGLRNPPVTEATYWSLKTDRTEYALPLTIKWYDDVKSGQRAFSFIGKTVEYRFRPDGTVESKQLPVSVLKNDPKPYRHPQRIQFISRITPEKSIPYWISGGIALIGGAVLWIFKKIRRRFSQNQPRGRVPSVR